MSGLPHRLAMRNRRLSATAGFPCLSPIARPSWLSAARLQLDDLVVELHPPAPAQDHVHLLLLPVRMAVRKAIAGRDALKLKPDRSSSSASVAKRNSRSGAPSNLDPRSSRSCLRFLSVNGTVAIVWCPGWSRGSDASRAAVSGSFPGGAPGGRQQVLLCMQDSSVRRRPDAFLRPIWRVRSARTHDRYRLGAAVRRASASAPVHRRQCIRDIAVVPLVPSARCDARSLRPRTGAQGHAGDARARPRNSEGAARIGAARALARSKAVASERLNRHPISPASRASGISSRWAIDGRVAARRVGVRRCA
jgi:hypothetical protein